ncbi:MAG: hypothetical protein IJL74_00610 [Bacilli bacterium]|nr:hypothetical protein [Bacilli bacterium]
MYVIKVGNYYIKDVEVAFGGFTSEIVLSKEIMKGFTKEGAERIAKMVNGDVISMVDVETNDEGK